MPNLDNLANSQLDDNTEKFNDVHLTPGRQSMYHNVYTLLF